MRGGACSSLLVHPRFRSRTMLPGFRTSRRALARICNGVGLSAVLLATGCARSEPASGELFTPGPQLPVQASAPAAFDNTASHDGDGFLDVSPGALWARWNALRGDPYELDAVERFIEATGPRLECSDEGMVQYAGTAVRYHVPVKVSPPFQERLARFEELLGEVATEFYGRPPRRIRHLGAFSCRLSRNRSQRLSEHALGNAIDVLGFDFGPASKEAPLAPELPRQLRGPFQVRVSRHWNANGAGVAGVHGRFLRRFTERLVDRSDIFRIAIGPSHRGHHDHFHFDVSPWRYVDL